MAKQLLVLDEVLAILDIVGVSAALREKFRASATAALRHKVRGHVPDDDAGDAITVSSGYGQNTKLGFVELTLNGELVQMDAAKAREIGLMLIESAEAATSDQIVMTLMREKVGLSSPEALGRILIDLRELRQGTRGTSWPS